jgi:hypothetical protein
VVRRAEVEARLLDDGEAFRGVVPAQVSGSIQLARAFQDVCGWRSSALASMVL